MQDPHCKRTEGVFIRESVHYKLVNRRISNKNFTSGEHIGNHGITAYLKIIYFCELENCSEIFSFYGDGDLDCGLSNLDATTLHDAITQNIGI
jgi:hypothetical protein